MATQTTNLSANSTDTLVATLNQKHKWNTNEIGIHAHGDFDSGTLTFDYSLDGGTTKAELQENGSQISLTASGGKTWKSPVSTGGQAITIYATLSGATSPDINVNIVDPNFGN